MPAKDWPDPTQEKAAVEAEQGRLRRIQTYKTTATRQQARAVSQLSAAYPHMSPGTVLPLAMSGSGPASPLAQQVALSEAKVKKKKRGFFGAVGDFVGDIPGAGVVGNVAGGAVSFGADVLGEVGEVGTDILKPAVRTVAAVAAAPFEEAIGGVRALAANVGEIGAGVVSGAVTGAAVGGIFGGIGAIPGAIGGAVAGGVGGALAEAKGVDVEGSGWRPQSTLLTSLTGGGSMGQGYLPGGAAYVESGERARETGRIGSHAFTPGRFFAATVFDEDTTPYNLLSGLVDLPVAWKLDPAAIAGKQWKVARQGSGALGRSFVPSTRELERLAAGVVDGAHRPGIIRSNVDTWLAGPKGVKVKEILAQADSYEDIRRTLGKDVDHETILDVLDAKTIDEVDYVLRPKLGIEAGLELKPKASTPAVKVRRVRDQFRFTQDLPRDGINLSKPEEAIEQFTRFQNNARLPYETISKNNEMLSRALRDGDISRAKGVVVKDFIAGPEGILVKNHKVAPALAKQMGDIWDGLENTIRADLVSDMAEGVRVPALRLGGETVPLAAPGSMMDVLDNLVDFDKDTIRNIRAVTSRYSRLTTNPAFTFATGAAEQLTNKVWKLTALLRGAYFTRNVGEENLRMAASGLDSAWNSPMAYVAWVAADDGRLASIFRKFGGGKVADKLGRGDVDLIGRAFNENPIEVERALRGEMNNYAEAIGRDAQREGWLDGTLVRGKTQSTWRRDEDFYVDALTERIDSLHRDPIARHLANPEMKGAVRDAPGFPWAPDAVMRDPVLGPAIAEYARLSGNRALSTAGGRIPDSDAMRAFLSRSLKQAQDIAGGSPHIWDAIATGTLDGIPIRLPNGRLNPEFRSQLAKGIATGAGPEKVVGSSVKTAGMADRWNRAVTGMFDFVGGNRTATLSRSPTYRQLHWEEARKMITEASPEAQREILENAAKARMPKEFLEDMGRRAKAANGELSAEELDILVGGRAARQTNKLLFNAVEKNQLSDILRVVFPFMEPQMNSLATWAKLGMENPQIARRIPQIMNGARGTGTFYKDPVTGEEMFAWPGSKLLTDTLIGVPIPLGGRVAGLNMFGSGLLPGAGPVVQVSTRWFLPDKPQFDQIRDMVDPFGESASGGVVEQFGPGWLRKLLTGKAADPGDKAFGDAIFAIYTQGVSTGEYDNTTNEGVAEAMEDAKGKARWLHLLSGAAALGGAPTIPSPEFIAADKEGRWHMIGALKDEYQKFQEEDFRSADERFLEKFGSNVGLVMQPTTTTRGKIPGDATKTAGDWVRAHPSVVKKYDAVYGLFAPVDAKDEFDSQTWARQIRTEERWPLDPEQRIRMGNDKMARMVLYNVTDRFGPYPSKQQQAVTRSLRESLRREYPGFEEHLDLPEQVTVDDKILQLERAVGDKALAGNPVVEPMKTYLTARAKLNEMAKQAGRANIKEAKDMAPLRAVLRQLGGALATENPAFGEAWERVFRSEIDKDEVEEPVSA